MRFIEIRKKRKKIIDEEDSENDVYPLAWKLNKTNFFLYKIYLLKS